MHIELTNTQTIAHQHSTSKRVLLLHANCTENDLRAWLSMGGNYHDDVMQFSTVVSPKSCWSVGVPNVQT